MYYFSYEARVIRALRENSVEHSLLKIVASDSKACLIKTLHLYYKNLIFQNEPVVTEIIAFKRNKINIHYYRFLLSWFNIYLCYRGNKSKGKKKLTCSYHQHISKNFEYPFYTQNKWVPGIGYKLLWLWITIKLFTLYIEREFLMYVFKFL